MDKQGSPIRQTFQILSKTTVLAASNSEKMAKFHGEIVRDSQGRVDLAAEMKKHPEALWMRVKAIVADEPNDNGDYFSKDEVLKSYHTFEGVPVFTNHENQKVENAKGKVVQAEWVEAENAVYCTMYVDRGANPALCRAIEEGYVTDVSMGTQVDFSTCSVCENKAYTADTYCPHVRTMKGRRANGKHVFEKNYGLKFIEVSVVTDGACPSCIIEEILDPNEFVQQQSATLMRAADSFHDIVKTNSPDGEFSIKEAGQEEIQQLNQAMDLIEKVSRKMLDQRQYIDLEFLSKVVEVLADLQHVNDELVDQGYGSIGPAGPAQQQMGVPPMPENMGTGKEQPAEGQKPSVMGPVSTGVGKVTEPAMASSDGNTLLARGARIKDLHERAAKIYEEQQRLSGGDEVNKEERYDNTVKKLATVWDNPSVRGYKTEASEGDFKVVVGTDEIIGLRGGNKIAALKVADLDQDTRQEIKSDPYKAANILLTSLRDKFAGKAPTDTKEQLTETFEAQLESQKPPLHPREKDVRESITEDQLSKKREGYDYHARKDEVRDAITEKQLRDGKVEGYDNFKVQDDPRDETIELQLRNSKWKGNVTPAEGPNTAAGVKDQLQQIHEGQLEDWRSADKGHNPTDSITEKQLTEDIGEPWGRRIASKEDAKAAYAAGMKAIVRTALATGATPDEVIEAISSLSSPKVAHKAIQAADILGSSKSQKSVRHDILRRASFHGINKLAVASKNNVESYLLGSMHDVGMTGEVGIEVLSAIASQKDAFSKMASAIEKGLEDQPKAVVASAKDFLKEAMGEDEQQIENVKVLIASADIKADDSDKEAFAKAAFARATKIAESQGVKITGTVHVSKKDDGMVEVAMLGFKEAGMPDFIKEKIEERDGKKDKGDDKKDDKGDKKENPFAKKDDDKDSKEASADLEMRKEARKKLVEAQAPAPGGGAPGGAPMGGMGGGGTTMPAAPAGDPTAGVPPQGALTTPPVGEEGEEDEAGGEAMPPGSICPACGTDDVDTKSGEFNCNNCGASGNISVRLDMKNWPGSIEEKSPEKGDGGMGDDGGGLPGLEGGGGMEMGGAPGGMDMGAPSVAASFKVTPEMVKIAGNKPVGTYCPRCGSAKTELKAKMGSGEGKCISCASSYKVASYVDKENLGQLWASVQWKDTPKASKTASKTCSLPVKKAKLESALKTSGLVGKFNNADLKGKARVIAELHEKGLL